MKSIRISSTDLAQLCTQGPITYLYQDTPAGKMVLFMVPNGIFEASFVEPTTVIPPDYRPAVQINGTLLLIGTDFQVAVWKQLLLIPSGVITTYKDIAVLLGRPNAARAVGNAVGSNNISYFIPCHRVVHSAAGKIGYRWGAARKRALLQAEQ